MRSPIEVAAMEFADHSIRRMLRTVHLIDRLMQLRIERLAHRGQRVTPWVRRKSSSEPQHHLDPFDDRLAVAAAAAPPRPRAPGCPRLAAGRAGNSRAGRGRFPRSADASACGRFPYRPARAGIYPSVRRVPCPFRPALAAASRCWRYGRKLPWRTTPTFDAICGLLRRNGIFVVVFHFRSLQHLAKSHLLRS